jgi:hypothetical protein
MSQLRFIHYNIKTEEFQPELDSRIPNLCTFPLIVVGMVAEAPFECSYATCKHAPIPYGRTPSPDDILFGSFQCLKDLLCHEDPVAGIPRGFL